MISLNIGEPKREYIIEPFPLTMPVESPIESPVAVPAEQRPSRQPELVPA